MATSAAFAAFRRAYTEPYETTQLGAAHAKRQATYAWLWAMYNNSIFDESAKWQGYKAQYGLYRHTRSLYNPARRLVDFYAGIVYPGVLTTDAERLPDGTPIAIPLNDDIGPELQDAIGQLWQWSSWQANNKVMVRYGAALGNVAIEVIDDAERGKVWPEVVWPGHIADLIVDTAGHVKAYAKEMALIDDNGRKYTYRKEVDHEVIREYKDDAVTFEEDNPYGFVPLVWIRHTNMGDTYGQPAMRNVSVFDEVNSLASHKIDRDHNILEAPVMVSGEGVAGWTPGGATGITDDRTQPATTKTQLTLIQATNGSMSTVNLHEGEAALEIERLLGEIEKNHPELIMWQQLREMSQVTGPAAARLVGDSASYITEARANYDEQSIKLFQMATAIAGWRANGNGWAGSLNRQQVKFAPFDLSSYANGDLDFEIMPRDIVPLSPLERIEIERQRNALTTDQQFTTQRTQADGGIRARLQGALAQ